MATNKLNTATFNYGGTQLNLTKSATQAAVRYTPGMKPKGEDQKEQVRDFELVDTDPDGLDDQLDVLRAQPEVSVGTHVWLVEDADDTPMIPTGYLYIEFQPGTPQDIEREILEDLNLNMREVIGPDAYRVNTTTESPNPIKCAITLQANPLIAVAEPEFMTKPVTNFFSMPSGPYFPTQWHLENKGTQIPVIDLENSVYSAAHFRRGADAKVTEAWDFLQSLGNPNLKIAVIDTGFDTEHPKLRGNGTKLRNVFNAVNRSADVSPWYQAQDGSWGVFDHGTSCAAVAAGAVDNSGVLGAAPESRVVLIKLDVLSDDAIVKAFEHALLNGVDIISCSIGFPKPVPLSTWVTNTITKVARQGRNGLGIPIFIAAGNANPASSNQPRLVSDFAAHPEVICVSASNSLDEHSSYAFYGPNVFLCAPTNGNNGVGITTATVYLGADGQSLEHGYTSNFGGTSSATPLAAGVCALMLSANRNLSVAQIKQILRSTVDKIGGSGNYDSNGRSQYLGYGRLNALAAVQMASNNGTAQPETPIEQPIQPSTSTQKGIVTYQFLNVRSGPGTNYDKVKQLKQGDVVPLLEKLPNWWRIGAGQYVNADYVQVLAGGGTQVVSRHGKVLSPTLNVRSGPSTANAKVGLLEQGATVTILQATPDGWMRIGANQWVFSKYIQEV